MEADPERWIEIRSETFARVRLRLDWLRSERADALGLAGALAGLPGMARVEVRPYTGSVLCELDPERLGTNEVVARVVELTGVKQVYRRGERPPRIPSRRALEAYLHGSSIARSISRLAKELDAGILTLTDGDYSLADLAAGGLFTLSMTDVILTGEIPVPSWHHLLWRSLQLFSSFESRAVSEIQHPFEERVDGAAKERAGSAR